MGHQACFIEETAKECKCRLHCGVVGGTLSSDPQPCFDCTDAGGLGAAGAGHSSEAGSCMGPGGRCCCGQGILQGTSDVQRRCCRCVTHLEHACPFHKGTSSSALHGLVRESLHNDASSAVRVWGGVGSVSSGGGARPFTSSRQLECLPAGSAQTVSSDKAALAALPEESAMRALIEHLMASPAPSGKTSCHAFCQGLTAFALCLCLLSLHASA